MTQPPRQSQRPQLQQHIAVYPSPYSIGTRMMKTNTLSSHGRWPALNPGSSGIPPSITHGCSWLTSVSLGWRRQQYQALLIAGPPLGQTKSREPKWCLQLGFIGQTLQADGQWKTTLVTNNPPWTLFPVLQSSLPTADLAYKPNYNKHGRIYLW